MFRSSLTTLRRFLIDESGPTAVEYAVMLMVIALGAITSIQLLGTVLSGSLGESNAKINAAIESGS